jgi:hypothetical protein
MDAKLRDNLLSCVDCLVASSVTLGLHTRVPRSTNAQLENRLELIKLGSRAGDLKVMDDVLSTRKEQTSNSRRTLTSTSTGALKAGILPSTSEDKGDLDHSTGKSFISIDSGSKSRDDEESDIKTPSQRSHPLMKKKSSSPSRKQHRKMNTWSLKSSSSDDGQLKWRKGELIGKGSFGKVYMGMLVTGGLIAVKQVELKSAEDTENAKQLSSEIRLMEKLRHPNIVTLLGTERTTTMFNILMEYVPGKSIDFLLDQFGPFHEETMRSYTVQLVSALEYMHRNDIIHRDLKGKNVLVDTNGNLKLADFGSAKQFDNILSKEAPSISYNYTPLWTAPEVLLGHYGRKVDIWSLGCVLIEMTTAQSPWAECNFDNPFRALYHIGNSNSIPRIPDTLSPIAKDFIRQCLVREPDKRPDAKDLMLHPFISEAFETSDDDHDFETEESYDLSDLVEEGDEDSFGDEDEDTDN